MRERIRLDMNQLWSHFLAWQQMHLGQPPAVIYMHPTTVKRLLLSPDGGLLTPVFHPNGRSAGYHLFGVPVREHPEMFEDYVEFAERYHFPWTAEVVEELRA